MGPRWRYLFGEVSSGLSRNLFMTIASVVTVTVTLVILGGGLWTHFQVRKAERVLFAKVEISMYLLDEISPEQRDSLQSDLLANPQVQEVIYESKQQAYENALVMFEGEPELRQAINPETLPASFRVKLKDPEQFEVVVSQFVDYPGIDEIVDQRQLLNNFFDVMEGVRNGAIAVAILQGIAAVALISNTIRLTAFARREQTGIMKLVGATNWYIRLPFMLEAVAAGLLGAAIASTLLIAGDRWLLPSIKSRIQFIPFLSAAEVLSIAPILILIGVIVAALASFFSLRRFLDV